MIVVLPEHMRFCSSSAGQTSRKNPSSATSAQPNSQVVRLRDEFKKATFDYKASLGKLLLLYERDVQREEERLAQAKRLFAEGLIGPSSLKLSEQALEDARSKLEEISMAKLVGLVMTRFADTNTGVIMSSLIVGGSVGIVSLLHAKRTLAFDTISVASFLALTNPKNSLKCRAEPAWGAYLYGVKSLLTRFC